MLTAAQVKQAAMEFGADVVGIGNIERWQGAPIQQDPRQIMPEARSVVVMGFRIMRGSLRGVEEGTFFSSYASFGYGGITHLYMPMVVINLAKFIEDNGHEAIPIGQIDHWRAIDNFGDEFFNHSRPVAPGKARPDVSIHQRIAAYLAGLGEIGYSKVFLTPQFGPRQRFGIILTEAELQPDPIYSGPPLCNRCMACVKNCPGCAISGERTVKVKLAGHDVEWGEVDVLACDVAFRGGRAPDPAKPQEMQVPYHKLWFDRDLPITRSQYTPFTCKPGNIFETGEAVCGGRGCVRACMMSLEARGVLSNKFEKPFRRRPQWQVDWSDQPTEPSSYQRNKRSGPDGGKVVS
jgi:ferredoxin